VSLVVDSYQLGPVGTNCYVVRAERGAPEAVVVDPGDDARDCVSSWPGSAPAALRS